MSEFLRQVMSERSEVPPPIIDVDSLVARAERRIRRRRLVGATAALAVAALMVAAGVALAPRPDVDPPAVDRPARFSVPKLTYLEAGVVHYGGETFDTHVQPAESLAGTLYGFVLTNAEREVWFTDGSEIERIGHLSRYGDFDLLVDDSMVRADPSGALIAWVGGSTRGDAAAGELVVYDSRRGKVAARVPLGVVKGSPVSIVAVDGDGVYWTKAGLPDPLMRYDLSTGEQDPVDLPSNAFVYDAADGLFAYSVGSRFVVGNSRSQHGLSVRLARADLSPGASYVAGHGRSTLDVIEVATDEPVVLRPPAGYVADQFMGWMDNKTLAVWDSYAKAILTCAVPSGSCQVAVEDPHDGTVWWPLFPGNPGHRPG